MEETLRELRVWGSGAGSGSSSGSSSGSGSAVGPMGRRAPCPLSRTRSLRTQGGRGHPPASPALLSGGALGWEAGCPAQEGPEAVPA